MKVTPDQVLADYRAAELSQSACNLSGIVRSFADIIARMCDDPAAYGIDHSTDARNEHPICRLFAEQIHHLSHVGVGSSESYSLAYERVQTFISQNEEPPEPDYDAAPIGGSVSERNALSDAGRGHLNAW